MNKLNIDTRDESLFTSLSKNPPQGIKITKIVRLTEAAGGSSPIVGIAIEIGKIGKDIGIGLIAAWLYDKLKNHKTKQITINQKTIYVDQNSVTKIVEENIKLDQ